MTAIATVRFEIVDVTEDADLRRQLADALAAVEEWRAAANDRMIERDTERAVRDREASEANRTRAELASARAENERLRGELRAKSNDEERHVERQDVAESEGLFDPPRDVRHSMRISAYRMAEDEARAVRAERDRAIAERDEARKALAAQIEKTNECTRALNAYPGVAELAALRARVAELEAELAKAEKQRDENHASAREWRSFFDTVIKERDAARIEVITSKNKLTDARAALDRLI